MDDEKTLTELDHNDESFGAKTIGSFSGSMLLINNMMGLKVFHFSKFFPFFLI